MPQPLPPKRDIADFFRPYSRTIPQKRPSSTSDDIDSSRSPTEKTGYSRPSQTKDKHKNGPSPRKVRTTNAARQSPFTTPKAGRTLAIPIRSPIPEKTKTATPDTTRRKLFDQPVDVGSSFSISDVASSNKVVKDGVVVAVRDSDDEDSESLESLADIFDRKQDVEMLSDSSPPENVAERTQLNRSRLATTSHNSRLVSPIVGREKLRALAAKEKQFKFDLSRVLDDHFEDEEQEENILKARNQYEIYTRELEDAKQAEIDRRTLTAIVQDGQTNADDVSRLLNAVDRTEALSSEHCFSFFQAPSGTTPEQTNPTRTSFPWSEIDKSLLPKKDFESLSDSFLSGFIAELAAENALSDKLTKWIFENTMSEPRDDLRKAYTDCIRAASLWWTRNNLTATDVQYVFQRLGADPSSLRDGNVIEAKPYSTSRARLPNPRRLASVLELFTITCHDMDYIALSKLCSVTTRLCLDSHAMSEGRTASAVSVLLATLIELPDSEARTVVHERIVSDMGKHLTDRTLQARLLDQIVPRSLHAARLRTALATIFVLGHDHDLQPSQANGLLSHLIEHISTSPSFSITRRSKSNPVDYQALTSLTHILDIAIADGHCHRLRPYQPSSSPSPPDPSTTILLSRSNDINDAKTKDTDKEEERQFNSDVDCLADHLHELFVSIADSGASHMRRTEAKDALQALHFRLLYSVRTRPRKKKHIFDAKTQKGVRDVDEYESEERGRGFMKKFLDRKK